MNNNKKIALIFLIDFILYVHGYQFTQGDSAVVLTHRAAGYYLRMDENNHDEDPKRILFRIEDATTQPSVSSDPGFTYLIEQLDETSWNFLSISSFDYETQPSLYYFDLLIGTESTRLVLHINNIDDEQPSMDCPSMGILAKQIYDVSNTTCSCTISDPDGWLNQMTFEIVGNSNEAELFTFVIPGTVEDTTHEYIVKIIPKPCLTASKPLYDFNVRAKDGAGHTTTPNELVEVSISVTEVLTESCAAY